MAWPRSAALPDRVERPRERSDREPGVARLVGWVATPAWLLPLGWACGCAGVHDVVALTLLQLAVAAPLARAVAGRAPTSDVTARAGHQATVTSLSVGATVAGYAVLSMLWLGFPWRAPHDFVAATFLLPSAILTTVAVGQGVGRRRPGAAAIVATVEAALFWIALGLNEHSPPGRCVPAWFRPHHEVAQDSIAGIWYRGVSMPATDAEAEALAMCMGLSESPRLESTPALRADWDHWKEIHVERAWSAGTGDPWSEEGGCQERVEYGDGWVQGYSDCGHL